MGFLPGVINGADVTQFSGLVRDYLQQSGFAVVHVHVFF